MQPGGGVLREVEDVLLVLATHGGKATQVPRPDEAPEIGTGPAVGGVEALAPVRIVDRLGAQ